MDIKNILSEKFGSLFSDTAENFAEALPEGKFIKKSAPGKAFTLGFGKEIMMPADISQDKYFIAGYRENNICKGVINPLYARAIWIDDNTESGGHLFISLDLIGLLSDDVNFLKASLSQFLKNINCRTLTVMCTANHSAPDSIGLWGKLPHTGKNRKFMKIIFNSAAKAASEAYRSRKEGKLYWGRIQAEGFIEDRRAPEVYSDIAARLRFTPDDKSGDVYIINFAAPCDSLLRENDMISGDYIYSLSERIKEKTGAETFFTLGAGAGITLKIQDKENVIAENKVIGNTEKLGKEIADKILSISEETELKAKIDYIRQEFYLPVENPALASAGNFKVFNVTKYTLPYEGMKVIKTEMSLFRIDTVNLLMLPGLIFPELVYGGYLSDVDSAEGLPADFNPVPLSAAAGDENILICSLANDCIGYIIPPNDYMINPEAPYLRSASDRFYRKHTEELNSLGEQTAHKIAGTLQRMMTQINKE